MFAEKRRSTLSSILQFSRSKHSSSNEEESKKSPAAEAAVEGLTETATDRHEDTASEEGTFHSLEEDDSDASKSGSICQRAFDS